jgi:hypothetical protein
MRISEKLVLADRVGRELGSRYSFREIDAYLNEFNIPTPIEWGDDKGEYAKGYLLRASVDKIIAIAEDLRLTGFHPQHGISSPPRNWVETTKFRLFISHLARAKLNATRLRDSLIRYGISGFVAHEDIHPTLEWQEEILRALCTMDAFLAIHTRDSKTAFGYNKKSVLP